MSLMRRRRVSLIDLKKSITIMCFVVFCFRSNGVQLFYQSVSNTLMLLFLITDTSDI